MALKLRLLVGMLLWLPFIAIQIAMILLGLVIVPLALTVWGPRSDDWPRVFQPWGNSENVPDWWRKQDHFLPNFWWYAVRNPVSNSRFWFKDRPAAFYGSWHSATMEAQDLIDAGMTTAFRWAWNGLLVGYRRLWVHDDGTYTEFWIGWKIGSSVPGLGFAMQFRYHRAVGT